MAAPDAVHLAPLYGLDRADRNSTSYDFTGLDVCGGVRITTDGHEAESTAE